MDSILTFIGKDSGFGDNNNSAYIEIDNKFILIDCRIYSIWKNKENGLKKIWRNMCNNNTSS